MNYLVNREKVVKEFKDLKFQLTENKDLFLFDNNENIIVLRKANIHQDEFINNIETIVLKPDGETEYIDLELFLKYETLSPDSSTCKVQDYDDFSISFYENNLTIVTAKEGYELQDNGFVIKEVDSSFVFQNCLDKMPFVG